MQIKLKRLIHKTATDRIDISRLHKPEIKEELQRNINNNLKILNAKEIHQDNINGSWQDIKTAMIIPAKNILTQERHREKHEWITEEILYLIL